MNFACMVLPGPNLSKHLNIYYWIYIQFNFIQIIMVCKYAKKAFCMEVTDGYDDGTAEGWSIELIDWKWNVFSEQYM